MNNKRLISLTMFWILVVVPGLCILSFADIEPKTNVEVEQHFEKANELRKLIDIRQSLYKTRRLSESVIAEYKKVISLSPNSKIAQSAQYWIGHVYFEEGRFDDALSAFQKFIDEYPASAAIPSAKLMIERVQQAKKNESLLEAATEGDNEQVKVLISEGANVNVENRRGLTPMLLAVLGGHKDIAAMLIAKGADLNARAPDVLGGRTPLYIAMTNARSNREEVVELLVKQGAKVPALHLAAYRGNLKEVTRLLQEGTDVNARDGFACTALRTAVAGGHRQVAAFLIGRGADVNEKLGSGTTPLHVAARLGHEDVAELLIAEGAKVDAKGPQDLTPLHLAAYQDHKQIAELLIAKGVDVNIKTSYGSTPLHHAAYTDDTDVAELLIAKGADVNAAESNNGWTPLHIAIGRGHEEMVKLLIANGADVNKKETIGNFTPLYTAARRGHRGLVELLLAHGADVNAGCLYKLNRTAAEIAIENNHTEIVKLLISKGADISLLHLALYMKDKVRAINLIESGADVNKQTPYGTTPLHIAVEAGFKDIVKLLIDKGADVNAKDNWDWTPLHSAVYGNKDIVEMLIVKGADVNARDGDTRTPLWYTEKKGHEGTVELLRKHGGRGSSDIETKTFYAAATDGDVEEVRLLIREGTDVNARDWLNACALHYAARGAHKETVELLLENGADMNARDYNQQTPLSMAKGNGHTEIVELLRKHGAKE